MSGIVWIENAIDNLDQTTIHDNIDSEEAIKIAQEEQLCAGDPSRRVTEFVNQLPPLFDWFRSNYREFPWRRTHDPWDVIVAEILLQRTRADAVASMYEMFLEQFPNAEAVYTANRSDIFEIVETLGFGNKRTETLDTLASTIVERHGGHVPEGLETLLDLPRIGPYTARACLCFARGEPLALVDANIATVVEHSLGYTSPKRAHKDRALYALLDALIPQTPDAARIFNLSLLDLRALICATDPGNQQCPLATACLYTEQHS